MTNTSDTIPSIPQAGGQTVATDVQTDTSGLKATLRSAYNALVQVRVSTVIADVDLEVTDESNRVKITLQDIDKERSIITQHDLVEGDIITVISTELESNTAIREYHAEQVETALKVLPDNLKMLVELFGDVVDALKS